MIPIQQTSSLQLRFNKYKIALGSARYGTASAMGSCGTIGIISASLLLSSSFLLSSFLSFF
jgi:hypothetical protein